MNTISTPVIELAETTDSSIGSSNVVSFCGKGLHYDWRSIMATVESDDLEAEFAQMGVATAHA